VLRAVRGDLGRDLPIRLGRAALALERLWLEDEHPRAIRAARWYARRIGVQREVVVRNPGASSRGQRDGGIRNARDQIVRQDQMLRGIAHEQPDRVLDEIAGDLVGEIREERECSPPYGLVQLAIANAAEEPGARRANRLEWS
jgi:hypothetical protein